MRTSGPGSSRAGSCGSGHGYTGCTGEDSIHRKRCTGTAARRRCGFTLIELLIVIVIIGISIAVVSVALRDGQSARLEEEGQRLAALLDMARAESRVAGTTVRWVPYATPADDGTQFRFVGLPATQPLPTHWLDPQTQAQIVGATSVLLGPEAILPPQRIVLQLADHRLELASDGLGPFAIDTTASVSP